MASKYGGIPIVEEPSGSKYGGIPVGGELSPEVVPPQPDSPVDFDVGEMMSNIPGSAIQLGKDLIAPILSPIETGEALLDVGEGLRQKAIRNINELATDRELPKSALEGAPDAIAEHFRNRYGSIDKFKTTAMEDPMGALADIASIVYPAASITKSKALTQAANVANPLTAAVNIPKAAAAKMIPENLPGKLYESAAKFSTSPKVDRKALIKTALEGGYMPTERGLAKLSSVMDTIDVTVDSLIDTATESGRTIPKKDIFKNISILYKEAGDMNIDAVADQKIIRDYVSKFNKALTDSGKTNFTAQELQKLKRSTYKKINWKKGQQKGKMAKEEVRKSVAEAAREGIEELIPEIGPLNKAWGDLLELEPHLQRSAARIENLNKIPLSGAPNVGVGAMVGGPVGAAAGLAVNVFDMPKVKSWLALKGFNAQQKAKIETLLEGNPEFQEILLAAVQSGRLQEGIDDSLQNP